MLTVFRASLCAAVAASIILLPSVARAEYANGIYEVSDDVGVVVGVAATLTASVTFPGIARAFNSQLEHRSGFGWATLGGAGGVTVGALFAHGSTTGAF